MPNTDVRIKLSADAGQVKAELQDIDRRIRGLGESASSSSTSSIQSNSGTVSDYAGKSSTSEATESILRGILTEVSLIRRVYEKSGASQAVVSDSTAASQGASVQTDVGSQIVSPPQGNNAFSNILGNMLSKAVLFGGVKYAWNYAEEGARSSARGESLAYDIMGSTLAYKDYFTAKKDAKSVGDSLGYSYEEVLRTSDINAGAAGFKDIASYQGDAHSLLKVSKAFGLDTSSVASASGRLSAMGFSELGDQKKFADLLAGSIVENGMVGRESEQLRVLESIADLLGRTLVKVEDSDVAGALQMYTALTSVQPELRGQRGASLLDSLHGGIVSGGATLDVLLGYGTKFTGIEGRVALERQKEKGISDPENLKTIIQNFEAMTGQKIYSESGQMMLKNQFGMSFEQIDALLSALNSGAGFNLDELLKGGSKATTDRVSNYYGSDVSIQEKYEIEKQDTQENTGEMMNNLKNMYRDFYNDQSEGGRMMLDAIKITGGVAGASAIAKGASNMVGGMLGGSSSALSTGAAASGSSGILGGLGGAIKVAGKAAPWVTTGLEVVDTYNQVKTAISEGDSRKAAEEAGKGVGAVGGMWAGASAGASFGATIGTAIPIPVVGTLAGGAIGGVIGGIGGYFAGESVGGAVGKAGYDVLSGGDSYSLTDEEKKKLQAFYSEVSRLYKENGNDAAQNYTLNEVVPYLNSIGISKSITDEYNTDVGRPDFMNDIESGKLGDIFRMSGGSVSGVVGREMSSSGGSLNVDSNSLDININLSGKLEGMTPENQELVVSAVISKISENSLTGLLKRQFSRFQNN